MTTNTRFEAILQGKTIKALSITEGGEFVRVYTEEDQEPLYFMAEGSCCMSSWVESVEGTEDILGRKILRIDAATPTAEGEEIAPYTEYGHYTLFSEKGRCHIDFRADQGGSGMYEGYLNLLQQQEYIRYASYHNSWKDVTSTFP